MGIGLAALFAGIAACGDDGDATGTGGTSIFGPAFTAQPSSTEVGATITPLIQVSIVDALGSVVTSATDAVTMGIQVDPNGNATLSGSSTVNAVNGVASFDDLGIDRSGTGFILSATVGSTSVASAAFDITFTLNTVTTGGSHTCGIQVTDAAYCWGRNTVLSFGPSPALVSGSLRFTAVTSGTEHACGISTGGDTYCWGPNHFGQLGDGNPGVDSPTPVQVQGAPAFVALVAGRDHTCGITASGAAHCWGYNGTGQLGTTTTENCPGTFTGTWPCSSTPLAVDGGHAFSTLSAGGSNTCGVTTNDDAYCWGHNALGQLGASTTEVCPASGGESCSTTPLAVTGGFKFSDIGTGRNHSCAVESVSGTTYCWGDNTFGQVGNGNQGTGSTTPVSVQGGLVLASVSGGEFHTCGFNASGTAFCWGHNTDGQLGDGNGGTHSDVPVAVQGGLTFAVVSAGGDFQYHTCGITTGGATYCWGSDFSGQLGTGGSADDSDVPVRLGGP
jgi:alpha-tubulin suppressor-like RCC1 family protein